MISAANLENFKRYSDSYLYTISMALPPSTKEGRTITGYPRSFEASRACFSLVTMVPGGCLMSSLVRTLYQRSLSSASLMFSGCVPQI